MRQQYHFRVVDGHTHIWDINRLLSRSHQLPVQTVALSEIAELDETWWYGSEGDSPTCRSITEHARLINETDLAWPVLLCPAGRLMDGMHRVCKALMLGQQTVQAIQLERLPEPDYIDVPADKLPY